MCKQPWADFLSPSARCSDEAARVGEEGDIETLIFVDVDGVLNVAIKDPGQKALELSAGNVTIARDNWDNRGRLNEDFRSSVEQVVATCERHLEDSADTLAEHASRDGTSLSELLLWRLAQIIRSAGSNSLVVLSSSWRNERRRVQQLEEALGRHLGGCFSFGAHTDACEESGAPEVRLQSIALFVEQHCARKPPTSRAGRLRVLVLDDFHIRPFDWSCEEVNIDGPQAVEQFLRSRARAPIQVCLELVHPYDEWVNAAGLSVQVGTGLTDAHLRRALRFLGGEYPVVEPEGLRPRRDDVCALTRAPATVATDALGKLLWWFLAPGADAWKASGLLLVDPRGLALEKQGLVAARSLMWPL
jgi:hypothetical protein